MILKDWQRQAFLAEDLRDAGELCIKSITHCTLSVWRKPDLLPAEVTAEIFLTVFPIQLPSHQTSAVHLGLSAQGRQQVWLQGPDAYNTYQQLRSKCLLLSVLNARKVRILFKVLRKQWEQFHQISQVILWIKEVNDVISSFSGRKEKSNATRKTEKRSKKCCFRDEEMKVKQKGNKYIYL